MTYSVSSWMLNLTVLYYYTSFCFFSADADLSTCECNDDECGWCYNDQQIQI